MFAMVPSRRFAIAVLTNGVNGWITARRLFEWALRTYFGLASPDPRIQPSIDVEAWVGTYETCLEKYTLRREGERLVLDERPFKEWLEGLTPAPASHIGVEVRATDPDKMLIAPGQREQLVGTVLRDANRGCRWLRVHRRVSLRNRTEVHP
ncbi:hypothetical protein NKH42_30170 [Mesorhizobium sp. M1142]